jgi:hypothetical protein
MSAKIGEWCCNHIPFWAWNLNLNWKCNKIWKNEKGMSFLENILFCLSDVSLQRYDTSIFEKNAFFTKWAAVHNFYITNSPWNLDLNSKSHKIFCLWDVLLQRYDSLNRRPIVEKTLFHTVGSCTQWPKQLTCLANSGGWREDQHMWDGQGVKYPCFFKLFLESQNHREKLNLWGRNWVHGQELHKGGLDNFLNFLTLKTF